MGDKQYKTNSKTDFFYYFFRNILLVSVSLVIISAIILSSLRSSATSSDGGTDNLTITISSACTLSSVVDIEHSTNTNVGTYTSDIGKTTIKTLCNDGNGYSVYAVGYSNNEEGNNKLINSERPEYSIDTGLNTSGLASAWAMKLTAGTGTGIDPTTGGSVPTTPPTIINGFDNYSTIPNVYTQVAKRTSGTSMITNSDASGSYLNTTYQIYANSYQPAGTYNGKVKYVIIHPSSSNNTISNIDAAFAAVGKQKAYQDTDGNYYYAMQDMNPIICASVDRTGEITTTQLVDKRDNNLYYVTKEKDGNCWMTQNLDFDIDANTTLNSITTDLNVAYDSDTGNYREYLDGYTESNGIIYYAPTSTATTIDFTGTNVPGWQNSNTAPYTANKTDDTGTGHASLGNYYNWTAAIASNNSSSLTQNTLSNISKNPKNSICPKGWRLPTISSESGAVAGSTNEFARLYNLYGNFMVTPLYYVYSGFILDSSLNSQGSRSMYSSSTLSGNVYMYVMELPNKTASVQNKDAGWSVRCVAR